MAGDLRGTFVRDKRMTRYNCAARWAEPRGRGQHRQRRANRRRVVRILRGVTKCAGELLVKPAPPDRVDPGALLRVGCLAKNMENSFVLFWCGRLWFALRQALRSRRTSSVRNCVRLAETRIVILHQRSSRGTVGAEEIIGIFPWKCRVRAEDWVS